MKERYKVILVSAFIYVCLLIGTYLGLHLIGEIEGIFISPFEIISGILIGTCLGLAVVLLFYYFHKRKNGKGPQVDERTLVLLKRYFLIVLYVVMFGSSALLLLLYSLGIESIEVGMIIVYMLLLYLLITVGFFVTKRL